MGKERAGRARILAELARAGRDNSDATVLYHAQVASLLDLHPTDYKALGLLEQAGRLSAGELGRLTGLASASVTNLIDRLERKGFVRRVPDAKDRRRILVEPVREKLDVAIQGLTASQRSLSRLLSRYADAQLAVIADFLGRNAARLRQEIRKLEASGS